MSVNLTVAPLATGAPFVDPATGILTQTGLRVLLSLTQRTGGTVGVDTVTNITNVTILATNAALDVYGDVPDTAGDAIPTDDPPQDAPDLGAASLLALMLGDVV